MFAAPLLVIDNFRPYLFSLRIPVLDVTLEPRFYGLFIAVALLVGYRILVSEAVRRQLDLNRDQAMNMILLLFFCGLIGARFYEVVFEWSNHYAYQPFWEVFAIWHGGLAIHGGILGGLTGIIIYSRLRGFHPLVILDISVLCMSLGQALGRWGNFFNGEAAGPVTDFPLGIVFPPGSPTWQYARDQPVHPTMIYESIGNALIFFLLWRLRLKNFRPGMLTALYLIAYSLWRSALTPLRMDNQSFEIAGTRFLAAYAISIVLTALALAMIFARGLWRKEG
jgi:phosphatidylglycerol---prolipoprotein diacylglyceryl transferase